MNAVELLLNLHKADGAKPLNQIPGRVWHRKLDEQWEVWLNGNMHDAEVGSHGTMVQACDCWIEFNGCPAGCFSMVNGDGVMPDGEIANYETFCAAIQAAILGAMQSGKRREDPDQNTRYDGGRGDE